MTPAEQDKELREQVADALRTGYHGIAETKVINRVMEIIIADRKRVAVEARLDEIERIDAANIDNGINFWFAHLKKQDSIENNNGWRTMRQYTPERIAELKAQQEEV